ncbi:hypothetical protein MIMGU_mgv1a014345mg [Erythranthe guttata]|uniref:Glutathione S-transferase 3, mitochondrial n=1 Tax=Erythranthe guttata TaxID=4155 RepID=A0A022QCG7_ERYGU|nr:hypothetical protein MIMGU_mgv1a014345mg [Erythranthe guttata]
MGQIDAIESRRGASNKSIKSIIKHFLSPQILTNQKTEKKEKKKKSRMAGVELLLPKEYGYVVLVLVLYGLVNVWMALQVGKARRKYKVMYPIMYATADDTKDYNLFNCVQRGHQNSLEMMPTFFLLTVLGGIRHPLVSASLGLFYTFTRIFYFKGYSTGVPKNRLSIGLVTSNIL